jgi:uncharacterized phage protein (TIGR02218 family)
VKTPIWEASSGALMALLFPDAANLSERLFACFDLYTITCAAGPVLRYTTCDRDVGYGGTTWSSTQVRIEPASQRNALFHAKVGLDVDTWQAVFFPRPIDDLNGAAYPDTIGSTPWLAAAAAGALDGATVTVDRSYFAVPLPAPQAAPLTPVGVLRIFAGRVAEVDLGRTGAAVSINSHLELLNVQMPRNLFQAPCRHRLFDAGCTLSPAAFAATTTCAAGSTRYTLVSSLAAPAGSGTYTLGRVVFTSGLNAGFGRSVRSWDGLNWTLIAPLPFTVVAGDAFTAYPGCDKQKATCTAFGNALNFGGEPYIPAPETAT